MAHRLLTRAKTRFAAAFLGMALCLSGCAHVENWAFKNQQNIGDSGVADVSMVWTGLGVTRDSVNGGQPLPGIGGRMYLLGPDLGTPVLCDGKLVVDMYVRGKDQKAQHAERWEIDPATLKRLSKKDVIGEGYTLFLPWSTFAPDITEVQMRAAFVPTKTNTPIYAPASTVNIRPPAAIPIQEHQFVPPPPRAVLPGGGS